MFHVMWWVCFCGMQLNSKVKELHELLQVFRLENLLGFSEICNPFSGPPNYSYIPEKCPKDALPISELPNVSELTDHDVWNRNSNLASLLISPILALHLILERPKQIGDQLMIQRESLQKAYLQRTRH